MKSDMFQSCAHKLQKVLQFIADLDCWHENDCYTELQTNIHCTCTCILNFITNKNEEKYNSWQCKQTEEEDIAAYKLFPIRIHEK